MVHKNNNRSWIVLDNDECVHARIHDADRNTALAIARAAFPEVEELRVVPRKSVGREVRAASNLAVALTAEQCAKSGLVPPVHHWAEKLSKHFVGTAGGL